MKRKMIKTLTIVSVAVLAFMLIASSVFAEGRGGTWGDRGSKKDFQKHKDKVFEELGFTEEQKHQLKEVREANKGSREPLRKSLKVKREELRTILEADNVDRVKIDAIASDIKTLQAQRIDMRIESVLSIKEILTSEQYSQFKEKVKEHKGRSKKRKMKKRFNKEKDN